MPPAVYFDGSATIVSDRPTGGWQWEAGANGGLTTGTLSVWFYPESSNDTNVFSLFETMPTGSGVNGMDYLPPPHGRSSYSPLGDGAVASLTMYGSGSGAGLVAEPAFVADGTVGCIYQAQGPNGNWNPPGGFCSRIFNSTYIPYNAWHHVLITWDTTVPFVCDPNYPYCNVNDPTPPTNVRIWVDGVERTAGENDQNFSFDDEGGYGFTVDSDPIESLVFFAFALTKKKGLVASPYVGFASELWMNACPRACALNDPSLFRDSGEGQQLWLGRAGENVMGTSPLFYFHGTGQHWGCNSGVGPMTKVEGTLTAEPGPALLYQLMIPEPTPPPPNPNLPTPSTLYNLVC